MSQEDRVKVGINEARGWDALLDELRAAQLKLAETQGQLAEALALGRSLLETAVGAEATVEVLGLRECRCSELEAKLKQAEDRRAYWKDEATALRQRLERIEAPVSKKGLQGCGCGRDRR